MKIEILMTIIIEILTKIITILFFIIKKIIILEESVAANLHSVFGTDVDLNVAEVLRVALMVHNNNNKNKKK